MTLPDRLRVIRERLGFTQPQVTEKTGIGTSSLSEFETGKRDPSLGQLHKLASFYHKPIAYFFEESKEEVCGVLLWREKPVAPACHKIEAEFQRLCHQFHNLEKWTNWTATDSFKGLFSPEFPANYVEVEKLAHSVWNNMGLGERPGESLLGILEEVYGVKIFHVSLGSETSSACVYSEEYGPAIILNKNNKKWRRNFDLAHELFHLITWNARIKEKQRQNFPDELEEKFANAFASRVLMPDQAVRDALDSVKKEDGRISYAGLDTIARQFAVSIDALLWRVGTLFNIPPDDVQKHISDAKAYSYLPPREDDVPPKFPSRYYALAVEALRNGEISSALFAEYLDISISEAHQYTIPHEPEPIKIPAGHF